MSLSYGACDSRAIAGSTTGMSGAGDVVPLGEAGWPAPDTRSLRESPPSVLVTRVPPVTDRNQAISLVEAALKSGRIVQADHDMRIDQIKSSASPQEIDLVVRDLQPAPVAAAMSAPTSAGAPTATTTPQQPWPLVNYGPAQGQAAQSAELAQFASGAGKKIGGIIAVVVFISIIVPIVGVVIGLVTARDTFDDINFGQPVDETTYAPGQTPGENGVNVHTLAGYEQLVAALSEETGGSTEVFSAILYPRYAVVYVPEEPSGRRYESFYWDGRSLSANDIKSTSDSPRIDLAEVRPEVVIELLVTVRGRVEDPTSWYASIDSAPTTQDLQISVYATNEYGEGSYILADADGTPTYESTYGQAAEE